MQGADTSLDKIITFPGNKGSLPTPHEIVKAEDIAPDRAIMYEHINMVFNFLFSNKDTINNFMLIATLPTEGGDAGLVFTSKMEPRDYSFLLHMAERDFMANAFN